MERYQYRVVKTDIAKIFEEPFAGELDRLGHEGWKLETTVQHERHGYSHEVAFVLSRRIGE